VELGRGIASGGGNVKRKPLADLSSSPRRGEGSAVRDGAEEEEEEKDKE